MLTALYLAPLLITVLLLASGRVSALGAGLAGMLSAAAAATLSPTASMLGKGLGVLLPGRAPPAAREMLIAAWLGRETLIGAWLAWQVIVVVLGGIFLWRCLQTTAPPAAGSAAATPALDRSTLHRRLWFATFLLGPFAESVTGFGVGCMVALAYILRLGIGGLPALLLALFSQMLVPWGALAIGTVLGASLSGQPLAALGYGSAVLQAPILLGYLGLFWWLLAGQGIAVPILRRLEDIAWTLALAGLLLAANAWLETEIAGAGAIGLLLGLRWLVDTRPDRAALRRTLIAVWPYGLLVGLLLLSRLLAPLRALLRETLALEAFTGTPVWYPLYSPYLLLLLCGGLVLACSATPRRSAAAALRSTAAAAWRPLAVTLLFIVMARFYAGSGMAAALADALHAGLGRSALLFSPFFAGIGGFLTASNAGANAMLMPLQAALAQQAGSDAFWVAALQNSVGSNLTMLSPPRVALGLALLSGSLREADVYRAGWPLALPALVVGSAAALMLLLV